LLQFIVTLRFIDSHDYKFVVTCMRTSQWQTPLRKIFAEFAQYLIEYKKTGKEDDDEEAEILADEEEDDDEGVRE